jgi:hypothetical protein
MVPHRNADTEPFPAVAMDSSFYRATQFRTPPEERVSVSGSVAKELTYIARLIIRIQECLRELGVNVDADDSVNRQIESMSILIHESMSISSRNYHSVQHVFDISRNLTDPVAVLSALFHDCIYYHVDGGLTARQRKKLEGAIVTKQETSTNGCHIPPGKAPPFYTCLCSSEPLICMVERIFGYTKGQVLTNMDGLNEYLSAVIAVRELEPFLPMSTLAEIATCIESTIPFRAANKETGETAADKLYKNLCLVNESDHLGMTDEQVVTAVQRAVILSNEDVENFGTSDRAWFLDNTWSLLTETNEALRRQYLYSVMEFQFAVFKMNGFFNFLNPAVVFQQFRNVPDNEEIEVLTNEARRNLEIGRKYVGAKLLSTSTLAAFAVLTGGDAPISLFMGDLPSRHRVSVQLEDTLPAPSDEELEQCDMDVYNLLSQGRRSETAFDIKESPMAAYLYGSLGDDGLFDLLKKVKVYPMTTDAAKQLLAQLPRVPVQRIGSQMAMVAMSRSERILAVLTCVDLGLGGSSPSAPITSVHT